MHPLQLTRSNSGATLIFLTIVLTVLIGMTALAVDLGQLYIAKQRAQNVCDASALAGVRYLDPGNPTVTTPSENANDCALSNNEGAVWKVYTMDDSSLEGITPTISTDGKEITVRGQVPVKFAFAGIFGKTSSLVSATAVARLEALSAASYPFIPIAVSQSEVDAAKALPIGTAPTQLKSTRWQQDGTAIGAGNFSPVDFPGDSGGADYKDRLAGDPDMDPVSLHVGQMLDPEPGNMIGPTDQGIAERIRDDTVYTNTTNADGTVSTAWQKWYADYTSPTRPASLTSTPRLVICPIIKDPTWGVNGASGELEIVGFAAYFVNSTTILKDDANNRYTQIDGYFVGATFSQSDMNNQTAWWMGPGSSSGTVTKGRLVR